MVSTVTASCKVYVAVVGLIEAAMTKFCRRLFDYCSSVLLHRTELDRGGKKVYSTSRVSTTSSTFVENGASA